MIEPVNTSADPSVSFSGRKHIIRRKRQVEEPGASSHSDAHRSNCQAVSGKLIIRLTELITHLLSFSDLNYGLQLFKDTGNCFLSQIYLKRLFTLSVSMCEKCISEACLPPHMQCIRMLCNS